MLGWGQSMREQLPIRQVRWLVDWNSWEILKWRGRDVVLISYSQDSGIRIPAKEELAKKVDKPEVCYPDMIGFLIASVQWNSVDTRNAARQNIMCAQGGNMLILKTNGGWFLTCSIIRLIDIYQLSWDLFSAWNFHLGAFLGAWPALLTGSLNLTVG